MADETKFSEEEIKELKGLQESYLETQAKFGQLVIARLNLKRQSEELGKIEDETKSKFLELQDKEKDIVDGLTKKYGEGSLDPTTGVFKSSDK